MRGRAEEEREQPRRGRDAEAAAGGGREADLGADRGEGGPAGGEGEVRLDKQLDINLKCYATVHTHRVLQSSTTSLPLRYVLALPVIFSESSTLRQRYFSSAAHECIVH